MITKSFTIHEDLLHLPIAATAPKGYVRVLADEMQIAELFMALSATPDFYCPMDLSAYKGCTITFETEEDWAEALALIIEGGEFTTENPLYADLYREARRPLYHFTSRRGWLCDPNGLFFDGENYHLYYQHNPFHIRNDAVNISWGHAVSSDGVHWNEKFDVIRPWHCTRFIASGSCIIDENGVAGYGKGAVIAAFTHLGSHNWRVDPPEQYTSGGQYFAYSTDGGNSFTLFEGNPIIPTKNGHAWRDPRLFMDPDGSIIAAVSEFESDYPYERPGDRRYVTFYRSQDFHHWTPISHNDGLFECPDIFKLTPDDGSEPRWVLYSGNGYYLVGDYAAGVFTPLTTYLPLDWGGTPVYAGQTWTGRDDSDGRMHIGWLRSEDYHYDGMPFCHQMTIPSLLTLVKTADGYRVDRNPIPALDTLRIPHPEKIVETGTRVELLLKRSGDLLLDIDATATVRIRLAQFEITFDPTSGYIVFDNSRSITLRKNGKLSLRLLSDCSSCEFFLQGEIAASYGFPDTTGLKLEIESDEAFSVDGLAYEMKGIHE